MKDNISNVCIRFVSKRRDSYQTICSQMKRLIFFGEFAGAYIDGVGKCFFAKVSPKLSVQISLWDLCKGVTKVISSNQPVEINQWTEGIPIKLFIAKSKSYKGNI